MFRTRDFEDSTTSFDVLLFLFLHNRGGNFSLFFSFVDNSYVAVADVDSHVYVFCQPGSFGGELRNRKSGKVTTTIARQIVISLKNHDQVMGFHAAPNCLFILTQKDLFVYTLHIS